MKSIALAQNMEHNHHTMDTLINMEHFHRKHKWYPLWRKRNEKTRRRHEPIGTSYQVQNANVKTEHELSPCFHDYEKLNNDVMQIMLF